MIEHIAHVARSIAPMASGIGSEKFEVFLKGEKTLACLESLLNCGGDVRQLS